LYSGVVYDIDADGDLDIIGQNTYASTSKPFIYENQSPAVPLPIELISFTTAVEQNKLVVLNWTTTSEINNDYFTIERSVDAHKWSPVSTVKGAGNSSVVLNYKAIDEIPFNGTFYYRLKQTDFNNEFSYSGIETVTISKELNIKINSYPNPVSEYVTIELSDIEEEVNYRLLSITSQVLKMGVIKSSVSNLYLEEIDTGIYFLKLDSGRKTKVIRIVKE